MLSCIGKSEKPRFPRPPPMPPINAPAAGDEVDASLLRETPHLPRSNRQGLVPKKSW
ncbi:hypothetical protein DSO57_1019066 [Entomophthora muscae]|uniref:Uncharacterized protein n=1 Tax=Entomophthora muscae TaxID=34485 RepID=A0ACC2U2L7_9FUNG|nr:hypothetical protein DSO57_1019066 [Entomophthora muscae]